MGLVPVSRRVPVNPAGKPGTSQTRSKFGSDPQLAGKVGPVYPNPNPEGGGGGVDYMRSRCPPTKT